MKSIRLFLIFAALAFLLPSTGRAEVIGGRPAGCPFQYCGCGASLYLFGRIVPDLNRAAEWFRFPRAAPAPRMAAVRRHHVMVLEEPGSRPGLWVVHDSNSGRHLTRRHEVSLAGYAIVDPSGGVPERAYRSAREAPRRTFAEVLPARLAFRPLQPAL